MTNRTPEEIARGLTELAERCEKATGPDRGSDVEIALIVWPHAKRRESKFHFQDADLDIGGGWFRAPRYTASLDAAMTLVPEGWAHGYRWNAKHKNARGSCEFIPEPPFAPAELLSVESRKCATPALALTAACLRALAVRSHLESHPK